ncbi:hypothetical protein ABFV53_31120, partial [Pseudomonas marginalis]
WSERCVWVDVGSSILAEFIERFGYYWSAGWSYNVGPGSGPVRDALRMRYAENIWARYEALVQQRYCRLGGAPRMHPATPL